MHSTFQNDADSVKRSSLASHFDHAAQFKNLTRQYTAKRELALKRLNPGKLCSEERLEDDNELMVKLKNAYKPPNAFMAKRASNSSAAKTISSRYVDLNKSKSTVASQHSVMGDTHRFQALVELDAKTLQKHRENEATLHAKIIKLRGRRCGAILGADEDAPDVDAEEILSIVSDGVDT